MKQSISSFFSIILLLFVSCPKNLQAFFITSPQSIFFRLKISASRNRIIMANDDLSKKIVESLVSNLTEETTELKSNSLDEINEIEIAPNFSDVDCGSREAAAAAALEFARYCGGLKKTPRTGWVLRGIPNVESVADHSWRVAALCFLLSNEEKADEKGEISLDVSKCIEMAIVHDLAESIVGDITPLDNVSKEDKRMMEESAMRKIASSLGKSIGGKLGEERILKIFTEYEKRESKESLAVKDLDLLDMIIQADEYERSNSNSIDLEEFFTGTPSSKFKTDVIRDIAEEVHRQREMRIKENSCNGVESDTNSVQNNSFSEDTYKSSVLSDEDAAFVKDFVASSPSLTSKDVESVVKALRKRESSSMN